MKDSIFNNKIDKYQLKITQKTRGRMVAKVLENLTGNIPTAQQITYVYSLLRIRNQKAIKCEPNDYLQVPVKYLLSLMTPYSADDYDNKLKNKSQKYMATVTKKPIKTLANFITVTKHNKGYCRRFMIGDKMMKEIKEEVNKIVNGDYRDKLEYIKPDLNVGLKVASWGGGALRSDERPDVSTKAWEKLKVSKFVFDWKLYDSREGKTFNTNLKLNDDQQEALTSALDDIRETNAPQYHGKFYIQGPGRLYTSGGPMALIREIRKHYVKPTNKSNKVLELDLKCAQLLILCDILGAVDTKQQILSIIKNESIWKYIGPATLHKQVKKVIIYGFCFGANMHELPYIASKKATKELGYKVSVIKEIITDCFSGILKPLVILRDEWLSNFTVDKIEAGEVDQVIYTNALGLKFSLNKELAQYKKELIGKKVDSYKIGGKLLSHLAQGAEQLIIQRMIAEEIDENILTYSYDGLSLEVEPAKVTEVQARLTSWLAQEYPESFLDFEVY
ncbi:hypothetical protein COO91_06555 [Nostoc flagelliforme CCNUN1]|uniref:Uncharacterized protein n=1 Tax=Nostoc flagelliforme CCNUN1 TaxID=2038116 RepID=A0A2K8SYL4_9NOSO|nr:hypothetical protein [Nostoc flagelliforme]AUB40538.1 hypothetical protein COO91_06555 [Nostoc flagelliforme CCNUN1]